MNTSPFLPFRPLPVHSFAENKAISWRGISAIPAIDKTKAWAAEKRQT